MKKKMKIVTFQLLFLPLIEQLHTATCKVSVMIWCRPRYLSERKRLTNAFIYELWPTATTYMIFLSLDTTLSYPPPVSSSLMNKWKKWKKNKIKNRCRWSCLACFLSLSFGTPLFSLPRLVFHHLTVLSPFSLLSLHFLFSFFQKSSIFIFKLHEYKFFSCFISKNFNFYLQNPWIQVRFLALSQKVSIFASIPVDVVFMCFIFTPHLLLRFLFFTFICICMRFFRFFVFYLHVHCFF